MGERRGREGRGREGVKKEEGGRGAICTIFSITIHCNIELT